METLISNLLIANITQPKHYTNKALGPLGHARLVRYLFRLFIIILYILNTVVGPNNEALYLRDFELNNEFYEDSLFIIFS